MTGAAPLLTEPVPRALLRLALPVLASQFLRLAYQWVDALWVQGLGVQATAAVTTSVFVLWCVYALNDVFGAGLSAYVSQLVGAGERGRAGVAVRKALTASAITGAVVALAGALGAGRLYALMVPGGGVAEAGATYLGVVLLGAPFMMMSTTCETAMRACGDTRTPFVVEVVSIALNVALAPLLIYGLGPFPRLELAGAALATVIAQALMLGCYAVLVLRRHPALPLSRTAPGAPVRLAGLLRVGVPTALIGILFSVVYLAFVRAAAPFGDAAVAIIGVANRIEAIQFVLAMSVGVAGATLLGQALGAGDVARARAVLRTAQRWALAEGAVFTLVLLAAPSLLLRWFSNDPALLEVGVPYLRVLSGAVIATALEIATAESVLGSGHTREISAIYTAFSLLRIPLAFVAPRFGGVMGIAWLITLTCVLRSAIMVAWVARGSWLSGLTRELRGEPAPPDAGAAS